MLNIKYALYYEQIIHTTGHLEQ